MKVLSVFGTRPEAIKMAPLIRKMQAHNYIESEILITAQHREILDQVLEVFKLVAHYDLNIMKPNPDLHYITSEIIMRTKQVFKFSNPDLILVHGDTATTFAATISAFYSKIAVGHVEAGLRTFDLQSPWPEEMNRQVVSRLATLHFAPTQVAKQNLIKEGVSEKQIFETGNTVIDSLFLITDELESEKNNSPDRFDHLYQIPKNKKIILVTVHRRENHGAGMENICQALLEIAQDENLEVIIPVHPNPNVTEIVNKKLGKIKNIQLIKPLEYLPFTNLMRCSDIILTDSGGIQEEAPSLGKPVLVLRNETERPEAVSAGTVKLVGTNPEKIFSEVKQLLSDASYYSTFSSAINPYGDGTASEQIINACLNWFKEKKNV